jgi:hypothetical protein
VRWQQSLDERPPAVIQRGHPPIHAVLTDLEPLEGHRADGEEEEVDAREARAEGGGGAFGVGDEGEVAGEELADETGDWGFFEACEDGGWQLRPTRMMWALSLVWRAKASVMPSPMPEVPPTKTPTGV